MILQDLHVVRDLALRRRRAEPSGRAVHERSLLHALDELAGGRLRTAEGRGRRREVPRRAGSSPSGRRDEVVSPILAVGGQDQRAAVRVALDEGPAGRRRALRAVSTTASTVTSPRRSVVMVVSSRWSGGHQSGPAQMIDDHLGLRADTFPGAGGAITAGTRRRAILVVARAGGGCASWSPTASRWIQR